MLSCSLGCHQGPALLAHKSWVPSAQRFPASRPSFSGVRRSRPLLGTSRKLCHSVLSTARKDFDPMEEQVSGGEGQGHPRWRAPQKPRCRGQWEQQRHPGVGPSCGEPGGRGDILRSGVHGVPGKYGNEILGCSETVRAFSRLQTHGAVISHGFCKACEVPSPLSVSGLLGSTLQPRLPQTPLSLHPGIWGRGLFEGRQNTTGHCGRNREVPKPAAGPIPVH